jgi:hypothetical protein
MKKVAEPQSSFEQDVETKNQWISKAKFLERLLGIIKMNIKMRETYTRNIKKVNRRCFSLYSG